MTDYSGMSRPQLVSEHRMLSVEVQSLKDKYQRDVFGLNNEGDPIGGDPAGGYANDLARLKAENESLRSDAARYRYVRNCLHRDTDILVTSKKAAHQYGDLGVYSCDVLDSVIDAALK